MKYTRTFNALWIVVLLAISACQGWSSDDPQAYRATTTADPLHYPALKPTEAALNAPAAQARALAAVSTPNFWQRLGTAVAGTVAARKTATVRATARPSGTPRATIAPTATKPPTVIPAATATIAAAGTPLPTATHVMTSEADCLNCVDPKNLAPIPDPQPAVSGLPCPAWAHDIWTTTGPNGKVYRTWHPTVQPMGRAGAGCYFDHAHGSRDPRGSRANNTDPAYGFEADIAGMGEPHAGFKTEYANRGECNTLENFCATSDTRVTVHMGTAGKGRLSVSMHTFAFDMIGDKGTTVHVRGMGDTGEMATQCDPAPDTSVHGFRLVAMPQDQAKACNIHSPYEVWQFHLRYDGVTVASKFATFDGITTARFVDGAYVLEPTSKTWPNGPFSGCDVDVYHGGGFYGNPIDLVDAYGRQVITFGSDKGRVVLDTSPDKKNTYKAPANECGPVPYGVN